MQHWIRRQCCERDKGELACWKKSFSDLAGTSTEHRRGRSTKLIQVWLNLVNLSRQIVNRYLLKTRTKLNINLMDFFFFFYYNNSFSLNHSSIQSHYKKGLDMKIIIRLRFKMTRLLNIDFEWRRNRGNGPDSWWYMYGRLQGTRYA